METPAVYSYIQNTVADGAAAVSSLMIDPFDELIWVGGQGGHVTSYYSALCEKYTSFQAHPPGYPVRDLALHQEGVISLSPASVRMNVRRGLTRWIQTSEDFYDLCTLSLLDKSASNHRLAVSGNQPSLFELDINRNGQIVRRASIEGGTGYKIVRNNPTFLACADFAGGIDLRNKDNFQVMRHLAPTSSNMMIQDMALLGNQLVTCGFSDVYRNRPTAHMYLSVYDLRTFRPQLIRTHFPPVLLKFLEVYTSRLVCVSTSGQFQMFDVGRLEPASPINSIEMLQFQVTCFDVSSNSQGIAFGDEAGNIIVYGTAQDIRFHNTIQRATEFADPVDTLPAMDVCDPLNVYSSVPLPICDGPLLSDLPPQITRFRYHVSGPVDPAILSSIKMVGQIGYAPNNGRMRRNEYNYITSKHATASFKLQDQSPSHESQIPLYYQKIDIKYNKLGIEDFDYNQYNNTCFAGLESSLPNCYSNDMLQVFYFLEPLRVMLTNHSCDREFCLSCELAYLFHMLENAQGMPCQASNFLRAFRTIPEVSALGLLSNEDRTTGCRQLIQGWTRFIFTQLHQETLDPNGESVVSRLFTMPQKTLQRCWCGASTERDGTTNMVNLIYSDLKESHISFADILRHSICANEVQLNTYCESCQRFSTAVESRRMLALPDILVINCGLESNAALDIWLRKGGGIRSDGQGLSATASARAGQGDNPNIQFINKRCRFGDKCNRRSCRFLHSDTSDPYTAARGEREGIGSGQSWLPFTLNIIVRGDGTSPTVRETEINNGDGINYELAAIVCVIHHDSRENIVSLINVGAGYHERHHSSGMSHWYVFNDFTVHSIKESEVGHLPVDWKQPCMLYYIRKDIAHKYKDLKVISPLTEDLIRKDTSIPRNASARLKTFTPLLDSEQFSAGDIVAMDAEFVTLNQEEAEIRSDGTRATIRPSQRSVARISCLRGQGQMEGVAFIDDYIATQEQVVDYLTQFSGIQPGDLDVTVSSKHLSTLKATYQKLRLLVDKGVIFVGHGLKNDFRVINLVVPQEQVRDTVLLFQLRNKRMLSLRFLAWHFFGETIQSETHDSIEDAKTALRLYRKYLELEQRDEINAALTELYEVGKKYNWKVPKDGAGGGYSNAGTPAAPLE